MTRSRALRATKIGATTVLALMWLAFLRPTWLGGSATYVLVRGDSMLPNYQSGDLLMAVGQSSYSVGDAVAYRVPAGEVGAGHLVVHRIADITADGTYQFQGDNNSAADPWNITSTDLAGRVVLRLPGVGRLITLLLSPVVLGGLAAAGVVMAFVARSTAPGNGGARDAEPQPVPASATRPRRVGVRAAPAAPRGS